MIAIVEHGNWDTRYTEQNIAMLPSYLLTTFWNIKFNYDIKLILEYEYTHKTFYNLGFVKNNLTYIGRTKLDC